MSELTVEIEQAKKRRSRLLIAAVVVGVVTFTAQGIIIARNATVQIRILRQAETNNHLLDDRDASDKARIAGLEAQAASSRAVLIELYAALNASQKQVADLGGVPTHFEFTVPSTTVKGTTP